MKKALLDEQVLFRQPKTEDSKMQKYFGGLQQKGRKKKKKSGQDSDMVLTELKLNLYSGWEPSKNLRIGFSSILCVYLFLESSYLLHRLLSYPTEGGF